eukprot:287337-Chlamydomonas_euryale.AAC.7
MRCAHVPAYAECHTQRQCIEGTFSLEKGARWTCRVMFFGASGRGAPGGWVRVVAGACGTPRQIRKLPWVWANAQSVGEGHIEGWG